MQEQDNFAVSFDFLLFGQLGAGRRSLENRFIDGKFTNNITTNTFQASKNRILDLGTNDVNIRVRTMDKHEWMIGKKSFWRGTVALLVYNVNNLQSFIALDEIVNHVRLHCSKHVILALVGTQTDNEHEQVTDQQIEEFVARERVIKSFKVSAKTGSDVDEMFICLAEMAIASLLNVNDASLMIKRGRYPIRTVNLRDEMWKRVQDLADVDIYHH